MRAALAFALVLALAAPGLADAKAKPGAKGRVAQAQPAPAPRAAPAPAPAARAAPAPAPSAPPPAAAGVRPAYPVPPASGAHGVRPAPGPGRPFYYYPRGAYPYRYYPYYAYPFYAAPLWWGWDWGWGYYPLYPRPPYPYREEQVRRVTTTLAIAGGPTRERLYTNGEHGATGSLSLAVEGERLGFHANISGFTLGNNFRSDSTSAVAIGAAHLTYAIIAGDAWRLRLEMGGSMVSWPDTPYRQGPLAFGPDVGLSGNLGLIGPLGLQGHARITPYPNEVVDAGGALAVRLGPVAVTGGWRYLFVEGGNTLASYRFDGPEFGLAFLF